MKVGQEVPDKGRNGDLGKDTESAGRGGTGEDRNLEPETGIAGHADSHTHKAKDALLETERATKEGHSASEAKQAGKDKGIPRKQKQDTQMCGEADADTSTRRETSEAIPGTTSHSANSGKRKKMELRRRSKIKVFIIRSVCCGAPCLCLYFKVTDSIDK